MHENFIALEQEKRDRIINAAMYEFSVKGYTNASTNEIVKKAEISKGALFHYFSSKQDLLVFLCRYSIDFFMEIIQPYIHNMSADVFERWTALAARKLKIAAQYPDMANFMQNVYKEDALDVQKHIKNEFDRFSENFLHLMYNDIDFSKFKPDVDASKALQIIWWVLEGFALAKQKEPFDLKLFGSEAFIHAMICEIENYLSMLKKTFYKEEYGVNKLNMCASIPVGRETASRSELLGGEL